MEMYIFKSFRHCQNKQSMYCTNVRNYVIKIHVFDYLTLAATFVWNIMLAQQKAVSFQECHLFCEAAA